MAWEVQTHTLIDGWVNVWTGGDGLPVLFDTEADAEHEVRVLLDDVKAAVADGYMESEYSEDDYRVVEVKEEGHGNARIRCVA